MAGIKTPEKTASICVPIHRKLKRDFKAEAYRRGVYLNEAVEQALQDKLRRWRSKSKENVNK